MKVDISDEIIEHVSILTKLELSPEEKQKAKHDMQEMLQYFDILDQVDTENIEPRSHVFDTHNFFREDVVITPYDKKEILRNAPLQKEGMYQVPKTIER